MLQIDFWFNPTSELVMENIKHNNCLDFILFNILCKMAELLKEPNCSTSSKRIIE